METATKTKRLPMAKSLRERREKLAMAVIKTTLANIVGLDLAKTITLPTAVVVDRAMQKDPRVVMLKFTWELPKSYAILSDDGERNMESFVKSIGDMVRLLSTLKLDYPKHIPVLVKNLKIAQGIYKKIKEKDNGNGNSTLQRQVQGGTLVLTGR